MYYLACINILFAKYFIVQPNYEWPCWASYQCTDYLVSGIVSGF